MLLCVIVALIVLCCLVYGKTLDINLIATCDHSCTLFQALTRADAHRMPKEITLDSNG